MAKFYRLTPGLIFFLWLMAACGGGPQAPNPQDWPDHVVGVVWQDDNGNGIIDGGEAPLSGLSVGVRLGEVGTTLSTSTQEDGGFALDISQLDSRGALTVEIARMVTGPSGNQIPVHFRQPLADVGSAVEIAIPAFGECSETIEAALADSTLCGTPHLPDLVPLVEDFGQPPTSPIAKTSARIDTETEPGNTLLRFASATANVGAGVLHMIPDAEPTGTSLNTWQRIWTSDDRFMDLRTGEFVFHEGHDHFHLDSFEVYRLLSTDGDEVAVGEKISFCLIDSLPVNPNPAPTPNAESPMFGIFLNGVCQDADQQQALNPGWADYYGALLDDQWIDITGVPAGDYFVEIVVDPDDLLEESDESNNRATFAITLTSDGTIE